MASLIQESFSVKNSRFRLTWLHLRDFEAELAT